MSNPTMSIPRFLLPQTSWRPSSSPPSTLRSRGLSIHFAPRLRAPPPPRPQFRAPVAVNNTLNGKIHSRAIRPAPASLRTQQRPHPRISSVTRFLPQPAQSTPANNTTTASLSSSISTSSPTNKDHHFDTLLFVNRLQSAGFTPPQAHSLLLILTDIIQESLQNLTRSLVPREEADASTYTQKVDFTKLRAELVAQDSTDAAATEQAYERLGNELQKIGRGVRDDISKAQASVRLDLSLEKGRVREEGKGMEIRIRETEARIEQEVAGLRERVEGVKFGTLQWLMGVVTGMAALLLGAWRLIM